MGASTNRQGQDHTRENVGQEEGRRPMKCMTPIKEIADQSASVGVVRRSYLSATCPTRQTVPRSDSPDEHDTGHRQGRRLDLQARPR